MGGRHPPRLLPGSPRNFEETRRAGEREANRFSAHGAALILFSLIQFGTNVKVFPNPLDQKGSRPKEFSPGGMLIVDIDHVSCFAQFILLESFDRTTKRCFASFFVRWLHRMKIFLFLVKMFFFFFSHRHDVIGPHWA